MLNILSMLVYICIYMCVYTCMHIYILLVIYYFAHFLFFWGGGGGGLFVGVFFSPGLFCFLDSVPGYSPGCPGTQYID